MANKLLALHSSRKNEEMLCLGSSVTECYFTLRLAGVARHRGSYQSPCTEVPSVRELGAGLLGAWEPALPLSISK